MDSSKHTEGCSSSESGWTMYIASPMQEDGNDCSDDTDDGNHHNDVIINDRHDHADDNEQQDSDDSMASDASSGPHHQYRYENPQRKGPLGNFKHSVGNKFNHCSPAILQHTAPEAMHDTGQSTGYHLLERAKISPL